MTLDELRAVVRCYDRLIEQADDAPSPYEYFHIETGDDYAELEAAIDVLRKTRNRYRAELKAAENVLHSPRGNAA